MRKLAILLMIASSVVISFSGLIVRILEVGPLVMNFYRGMFLMCAVMVLLVVRYRGATIVRVISVGWSGIIAGIPVLFYPRSPPGILIRAGDFEASKSSQ